MTQPKPSWPEPYMQPDRQRDCGYYAQAYLCRCLGRPDVTAEQVKAWRAETRIHETRYAPNVLGVQYRGIGGLSEAERRTYWLGPGTGHWLAQQIADGWIAQVVLHRIPEMGHAAVLLSYDQAGVQLMDPIYGHITEPWAWFLGPGPRNGRADWPGTAPGGRQWHGCTFIEGWYKL